MFDISESVSEFLVQFLWDIGEISLFDDVNSIFFL